jgi:hypothetical protein
MVLRFLSNQIIVLCAVFIATKHYRLFNLIMPFMITNGIVITIYLYFFFTGFKRSNIIESRTDGYFINTIIEENGVSFFKINEEGFKFFCSLFHFILIPIIWYIYQNDKTILERRREDIPLSLLVSIVYLFIYNKLVNVNRYKIININKDNNKYYRKVLYLPILIVTTLLYFYV